MLRHFVETRVTLVMTFACLAGLVAPGLPELPDVIFAFSLALMVFFSCYTLRDSDFSELCWKEIASFYCARYLVLPPVAWFIAHLLLPSYATAILLLTTLPTGIASSTFTHIFGGRAAPAFTIVVLSQVLAPLMIPLHFALLGTGQDIPPPTQLLQTLLLCLFVPMLVYALVRHHKKSAAYFHRQNKLFSIIIVALMIAVAVSKVRHIILAEPESILLPLLVSLTCYALYIVFGWYAGSRERRTRTAFATCSSFNNLGLGVSLALLHFPPPVILFIALSEISWAVLPGMMRLFLKYARSSE